MDTCFPSRLKSSMPAHRSRGANTLKKKGGWSDSVYASRLIRCLYIDSSNIFLSRNHSETLKSIRSRNRRYTQTELDLGLPYRRTATAARVVSLPSSTLPRKGTAFEPRHVSPASSTTSQSSPEPPSSTTSHSSSEPPELTHSDGSESSDDSSSAIHTGSATTFSPTVTSPCVPMAIPSPSPILGTIPLPQPRLFLRSPSPVKIEVDEPMQPVWDDLVLNEQLLPPSSRESPRIYCAVTLFLRGLGSDMESLSPLFFQLGIADEHDLNFLSTRSTEDIHALFPLQIENGLHVNFMQREYIKEGLRSRPTIHPERAFRAPPRAPSDIPVGDPRRQTAVWTFLRGLQRPMTEHCQALLNDGIKDTEHLRRLAQDLQLQGELRHQSATSTSKLCALDWLYIQDGLQKYRKLLET